MTELITLEGIVTNITFHNEENGFSVFKIAENELEHTVVGNCLYIAIGENVICEGHWFLNKTFGKQLQAVAIRLTPPNTIQGMEKYLGSGLIHGIGPQMAKILVTEFKEQVFNIIEHEPEKLLKIPGIGKARQEQLLSAWQEQKLMRETMVFLQGFGIGTNRAHNIFRRYGQQTVAMVKHNPYALCHDIRGMGFKSADAIALKLGIKPDSASRISAALDHVLEERASQGHCKNGMDILAKETSKLLNLEPEIISVAIPDWSKHEHIVEHAGEYCLKHIFEAEKYIADKISKLNAKSPLWQVKSHHINIKLAESQKAAFELALANSCVIITGGPGVGKTTILKAIIQTLKAAGVNLMLAAPTGRAAKRMQESTGITAKTIHRLLEFDPTTGGFTRNEIQPLATDVVVLDEASMIDVLLFSKLLKALPDECSLLIVGDVDQLPAVGPGNVLADLIDSGAIPTARLTEIFRQAKDSSIIINAHRVNNGLYPIMREDDGLKDFYLMHSNDAEDILNKIKILITDRIPNRFNCNPITDVQLLTPMRKGLLGTENLNQTLQATLNTKDNFHLKHGQTIYKCGDKVMQHQNDYDKKVFNGDIGYVENINIESNFLEIRFENKLVRYQQRELENLSLAYACTIHKSQGSEFPVVIIPVHMQHFILLEKNLLYTAITRAKELVILIGDPKAVHKAINTLTAKKRDTFLKSLLI